MVCDVLWGEGRQAWGDTGRASCLCGPQSCPRAPRGWELGWGLEGRTIQVPGALSAGLQRHWQRAVPGLCQGGRKRGCTEPCWQAADGAPCPQAVMSCQDSAPGMAGTVHPCNTPPPVSLYPDAAVLLPAPTHLASTSVLLLLCSLTMPAGASPSPPSPLVDAAGREPSGCFWHAAAAEEARY